MVDFLEKRGEVRGAKYQHKQELKMRNSRRNYTSYGRNRNTVKYSGQSLGAISMTGIISLMVLIVGLIYAAQSTKATSYDYAISEIDEEISELRAEKDDLAVERARLTSVAKSLFESECICYMSGFW